MIPWTSPNPLVPWSHPLWIRADTSDGDSLQSQIHEDEYGLRAYIKPGDIVVDCGAYIGAVSALAASLGAFVYAVEPLASNAELWRRNTAPWSTRCILWEGALTAGKERVPVQQRSQADEYGRRNRHVMYTALRPDQQDTLTVQMAPPVDINDVLEAALAISQPASSPPRRIAVLKVDIEGAEWAVLPAILPSLLARIDRVAMEVHAPALPSTTEECFAAAVAMLPGFRRVRILHNDIFLERE